ncbi:hypothetical protein HAX54_004311 [Datura stramonium]|uniref:N-acetyltransferase domain-containing protein n=1 Tax=Datura stramonium TaxID=4076 RepID=A0ABS8T6R9_DATST|nr:hypothetical protein [Datura stramonium]
MAQCEWKPNFHTTLKKELAWKCRGLQVSINNRGRGTCNWRTKDLQIAQCQCCSTSSFPVSSTTTITRRRKAMEELKSQRDHHHQEEVEYFVNENGWKVRRMIATGLEMTEVAALQAQAFYLPLRFSNYLPFPLFQAEKFSRLTNRLKNSAPDRYACLVAEASSETPEVAQDLVGVVDATVYGDKDVLQYLPGAKEYIYISEIAVLKKFRRQKVATALLKACEVLARSWGFEYLVLRAYEDDFGARQLYTNVGYKVVSADAPLKTKLVRQRIRVLMVKQVSHEST